MEVNARPAVRWPVLLSAALALATFALYSPVLDYGFVNYDDNLYVTDNARVQRGLTWDTFVWAWTTGYPSNWHPMTWMSHLLDVTLFGLDAGWHHFVNVLFHCANTVLLFVLLHGWTRQAGPSALVAALFALHPLHVESVAWIAERKDVLSTFFWFLALLAYGKYAQNPGLARYGLVTLWFALGLLSKAMLVTLPCLLLLLDYWPLKRWNPEMPGARRRAGLLAAEKAPLFALSIVFSVVAYLVQQSGGAMSLGERLGLDQRIANAAISYWAYLSKTVWPAGLAVFYPHPREAISMGLALMAAIGLIAVTVAALMFARRAPYVTVGWFWYVGTLVPVIGLVQVGGQAMANRYTYVPLVGIFIIIAFGLAAWAHHPARKRAAVIASLFAAALFTWRSHIEIGYWRSSEALFRRCLAVTTDNSMAHTALGATLVERGQYDEGMAHLRQSLELTPHYIEAHINLSHAYMLQGRRAEARAVLEAAIAIDNASAKLFNNLGTLHARDAQWDEAIVAYERAAELEPAYAGAWVNLGGAYLEAGDLGQSLDAFEQAAKFWPHREPVLRGLAQVHMARGEADIAATYYRRALDVVHDDAVLWLNYAVALAETDNLEEAAGAARMAVQLDGGLAAAADFLRMLEAIPAPPP